jgi:nucleoside-diphosphate-sugar epimerase
MILLTGAGSGLGKFLSKHLQDVELFTRSSDIDKISNNKIEYDAIIHCAASISHASWNDVSYEYFDDNTILTRNLLNIPHKKFIHISSIDIKRDSIYGIAKRISERIVASFSPSSLIIRPSGLIGNEMKMNTFRKIQAGQPIALTESSKMNYVNYSTILEVINQNAAGIVTVTACQDIAMNEIASLFKQEIDYGDIHYEMDITEQDMQTRHGYNLEQTSEDNIIHYIKHYE